MLLVGCKKEKDMVTADSSETKIFQKIFSESSAIDFSNNLTETDSLNYFNYSYIYMGGGVAAGDINNDGLQDIYFTGNQVPNKLYLNKGNLEFEDITETAGVAGDQSWYTGVTMADVNGDGYLDIYLSVGGKYEPKNNQLFINNGDGTFDEKAEEYGLDDPGNSVQTTFFDYDKDGDLDAYIANYPPTRFDSPNFIYEYKMKNVSDLESDHLLRNDDGKFTDVSEEAGVRSYGLTLSATVADLNNDSWPDIYVSNDFSSPDFLYMNNGDGSFREVVKEATSHTSFFGMGVDIADYNNDGYLDIYQVDMSAKDNRRKKANMASMNPDLFWSTVESGFHYQYMQNVLQTNTGVFEDENPFFADLSRITGSASTDWSWGPLFADFNNDGHKDLFVSNGTRREINNNDYFNKLKDTRVVEDQLEKSLNIPSEKIDNFMFQNNGDLSFEIANKKWGIEYEGWSNGVVYADLDNDGDLEIIINNIDDKASFFKNTSSDHNNFVQIAFEGNEKNAFGLGTRAYVKANGMEQMQELTLTRGFQSSVAPQLHFGLAKADVIEEIKIVWPDGKVEIVKDVEANQQLTFRHTNASVTEDPEEEITKPDLLFATIKDTASFPQYRHVENKFNDFKEEILLPHRTSTFGPGAAVGDLNGDGKEDFFIGAASTYEAGLYFQTETGFEKQSSPAFQQDKKYEDLGALIFDANEDGHNDIYVVSGGNEFEPDSEFLQDRLYINDGKGNFQRDESALPDMRTSGSRVYQADFDKDGKQDLLVLGRLVPGYYPLPAKSYILKNVGEKGKAKYRDITKNIAPEFQSLGMATSAEIVDIDEDGWKDIVVVGEWMPIRVFKNSEMGFTEISEELGLADTAGWWWSIKAGDFDNDGDMDFLVGNLGRNYKYTANEDETFDIYFNDFDENQKQDIVLSYYNDGEKFPLRGRECSSQQMPGIKNKFPDYQSFSTATLEDVYTEKELENSLHYQVKSFASVYLENKGGKFVRHELPSGAQISSINQILVDDYDKDGKLDALIAGNLFWSEVETTRNDAGYGMFLKGDGKGNFQETSPVNTGFFVPGDVKDMLSLKFRNKEIFVAVKNDDLLQFVEVKPEVLPDVQ
ncbi:hypothetical protein GCM10007103_03670 [Salinimicrobium marinum]|uniref:ASPIC/UnbV domain-containing protein n=2 Tax=Salinimicrobium marinum TaxID=680283 RepID=A0A918S6K0_9FLAO|nr:hypothetical protein GCM10007103_03670 [Salinimicrobium marinum]